MAEALARTPGWAADQRRGWSAPRLAAALLLHLLVLVALTLAIDRVELPRRGVDRVTRLIEIALKPAVPPPELASKPPASKAPTHLATAPAPTRALAPAAPSAREDAEPSSLPPHVDATSALQVAAAPPASAPSSARTFLDSAATRQAIRDAARGSTLASRSNELTHEDQGSELLAADGSHSGDTRHLPPPPPAERLAQGVEAAHKDDCMKGQFFGGGAGLLSLPFLVAAEAMGKCAHK
jgi:hypothetical protein